MTGNGIYIGSFLFYAHRLTTYKISIGKHFAAIRSTQYDHKKKSEHFEIKKKNIFCYEELYCQPNLLKISVKVKLCMLYRCMEKEFEQNEK